MKKSNGYKTILCAALSATSFSCINLTSCNDTIKYPQYSLVCMGDSITYGYLPGGGQMPIPYPKSLQTKMEFGNSYNYGICGSTISNGSKSFEPMVDRISQMTTGDIIIFWGGVNDYQQGCPLGSKGSKDPSTVYGALDNACQQLTTKYVDKFIMFITPLPTTAPEVAYPLVDVCEAIKYTCFQYDIPVLDLYTTSGFEEEMTKEYSDGIHPTQKFILNNVVPKIYEFIKEKI